MVAADSSTLWTANSIILLVDDDMVYCSVYIGIVGYYPNIVCICVVQELWEENLSAAVSLQVLEIIQKFSEAVASHTIATDYGKLDCITSIFMIVFSHNQPLAFWKAMFPVFNTVFELHGATLMSRENDRFLKQIAFHLLRLGVFRNENIRKRAVIGLQILVRVSLHSNLLILYFFFLISCCIIDWDHFAELLLLLHADRTIAGCAYHYII